MIYMPGQGVCLGGEMTPGYSSSQSCITALNPISHYRHKFLEVIYFQFQKKIKWAISL